MKILLCAVVLFSLAACAPAPAPVADTHDADVKAVQTAEQAWQKAWAAKDLDGIAANYASDATLIVPGSPTTKGTQEIRAGLAEMLKDPALSLQFASTVTEVSGNLAYQRGTYSLNVTDGKTKKPVHESGSFVTIYKKQTDGSWKAIEDINAPGPAKN